MLGVATWEEPIDWKINSGGLLAIETLFGLFSTGVSKLYLSLSIFDYPKYAKLVPL